MEANGIVLSPDPRLRQECAVIEEITPAIEALAEKMKKMMFENGGCGLAAPQIGELIQLVTIDCDYSDKSDYDPYVLINPVIVEQSDIDILILPARVKFSNCDKTRVVWIRIHKFSFKL